MKRKQIKINDISKNPGEPMVTLATTDLNAQGVDTGGVTLNVLTGNPETAPAGTAVVRKQIAVSLKC